MNQIKHHIHLNTPPDLGPGTPPDTGDAGDAGGDAATLSRDDE